MPGAPGAPGGSAYAPVTVNTPPIKINIQISGKDMAASSGAFGDEIIGKPPGRTTFVAPSQEEEEEEAPSGGGAKSAPWSRKGCYFKENGRGRVLHLDWRPNRAFSELVRSFVFLDVYSHPILYFTIVALYSFK
jgi:hypothetical protein